MLPEEKQSDCVGDLYPGNSLQHQREITPQNENNWYLQHAKPKPWKSISKTRHNKSKAKITPNILPEKCFDLV